MYSNTQCHINYGSEGPSNDPYGYIEVTVWRNGNKYTYHGGLGDWLEINDEQQDIHGEFEVCDTFKQLTGGYPHQFQYWIDRNKSKKRNFDPYEYMSLGNYV